LVTHQPAVETDHLGTAEGGLGNAQAWWWLHSASESSSSCNGRAWLRSRRRASGPAGRWLRIHFFWCKPSCESECQWFGGPRRPNKWPARLNWAYAAGVWFTRLWEKIERRCGSHTVWVCQQVPSTTDRCPVTDSRWCSGCGATIVGARHVIVRHTWLGTTWLGTHHAPSGMRRASRSLSE
jgi:hypothetical protein